MNVQLTLYRQELQRQIDKLCAIIEGLSAEQLNWKPPVEESNSIYVLATHTLGNIRGWVLGICCGQPIDRDRAAEFVVSGPDAAPLIERAQALGRDIEAAFGTLDAASLDELREARQNLWGAGTTHPVSGREAILHALEHAANHIGHIEITRDLARAGALR
jgi:hypothetical protein